jgi:predicted DNA-binding transcriptional regulator AlpA
MGCALTYAGQSGMNGTQWQIEENRQMSATHHTGEITMNGRPTMTIPEASRALGFGRSLGYELAAQDKFPCRVIRAGKRYTVPRVEVLRTLGLGPSSESNLR